MLYINQQHMAPNYIPFHKIVIYIKGYCTYSSPSDYRSRRKKIPSLTVRNYETKPTIFQQVTVRRLYRVIQKFLDYLVNMFSWKS